ncbi:hypothetical protein BGX28_001343 [Mortierella sp. GBA30]|nr:hypothetical protein BGX28_001343 [Mortierella sp. GBA30]
MAMVSESTLHTLAKNRISFREDLNTRHCVDDGFSSDDFSDDDEDEESPSKDPETAEIASLERKALKYRKSLTMLNQIAGLRLTEDTADGQRQPSKEHLLAAKKSIDDLTAWVNAAALEGDDDPFGEDDN